ncbi:YncE family protein [Mesorhizobium marinum]|uniref:YncE family protein n=1 Tax=Mesorhizobium marinum TaxID=3228790 RepID=UPI003466698B
MTPGLRPREVAFTATAAVRGALARVGRTEDVRFSPDNRLLAIAGFERRVCLLLRVAIEAGSDGPVVVTDDFMEITSDGIGELHGVDFIDGQTLAVANRDAGVAIIRLPPGAPAGRKHRADVLRHVGGGPFRRIRTPGSLAIGRLPAGQVALFVCNNYAHRVTRHVTAPRFGYLNWRNDVLLRQGLDIPDGIALSGDGRWIAVSSHGTRDVKLYDAAARLGPDAEPAGVLRQANYPHGLRFTADDRHIVVADAASPNLHVYERGDGWEGGRDPVRSVTVLDEATFLRGRHNPEEGGPKGLDIDRTGRVVAVTCEEQQLAFFTLSSVLGNA